MKNPNLIGKLRAHLPDEGRNLLDSLRELAERRGMAAYLVGGPLRDLLLDRPSLDLDIAVEGDAMALAHELVSLSVAQGPNPEAPPQPRVITHPTFLTATVRSPAFHLDLITARSETYTSPGALPSVKLATIREDLLRRDFTISAMALRLDGPDAGRILDPSHGQRDLDAYLIRTLHEHSFEDDATRILRAFRYAARLGFEIEPKTLTWLKRDIRYLETISGTRLHHEFARIFAEGAPEAVLFPLYEAGVLTAIHPALRFGREHAQAFARLRDLHPTGARAAYWPVLALRLTGPEAADLARRLVLTRPQRAAVEAMPALERLASAPPSVAQGPSPEPWLRDPHLKRSALAELLASFPLPTLWALAALTDVPTIRDRLLDYLTKARHERPQLTGDDLLALGIPRGPQLGEILARLRGAKLDGEIMSRQDEETYVQRMLSDEAIREPAPSERLHYD